MEKNEKIEKDVYYASLGKLVLKVLIWSVIGGLVLTAFYCVQTFFKIDSNIKDQLTRLTEAYDNALQNNSSSKFASETSRNDNVVFFAHYMAMTDCSDQELMNLINDYYMDADYYIVAPDGEITAQSITAELNADKYDPKDMIASVKSGYREGTLEDVNAFYEDLPNGHYIFMLTAEELDYAMSGVVTPQEVIASAMQFDDADNDSDIVAFAIHDDEEEGTYAMTIIGKVRKDEEPDLFFDVKNSFTSVSDEHTYYECVEEIDGRWYLCVGTQSFYDENCYIFYTIYPHYELQAAWNVLSTAIVLLFVALLIMSIFSYYLHQYHWLHPEDLVHTPYINRKKMLLGTIVASILLSVCVHFAQTLFQLSINVLDDTDSLDNVSTYYNLAEYTANSTDSYFKRSQIDQAKMLAYFIGKDPELRTKEELTTLSLIFDSPYMILYDLDGQEILSTNDIRNYTFPTDSNNPASALNQLKTGVPAVYLDPEQNDYTDMIVSRTVANIYDNDHIPVGYLEIATKADPVLLSREAAGLNNVLRNTFLTTYAYFILVDSETKEITYSGQIDLIGQDASQTLTADALADNYYGLENVGGEQCYLTSRQIGKELVYISHPVTNVYFARYPFTFLTLIMFLIGLWRCISILDPQRKGYKTVVYMSSKNMDIFIHDAADTAPADTDPVTEEIAVEDAVLADKRFNWKEYMTNQIKQWITITPENKMEFILKIAMFLIVLMLIVRIVQNGLTDNPNSLMSRILSGKWPKGYNVFSTTANILVILVGAAITFFIREIIKTIGQLSDTRGETITRLLSSAVGYCGAITIPVLCLINYGLDPSAMVTSAGLVSVAIGIGSRDLITDIIAGMFIIFEGSLKVGDIVNAGGYQGYIKEIGIRNTTIRGWDYTEKIVGNRNMNNLINLSANNIYSVYNFSIQSESSANELKALFAENFKDYKKKYASFRTNPFLTISERSITGLYICTVLAEIDSMARTYSERKLYEDIEDFLTLNDLDAHWIHIPGPSVSQSLIDDLNVLDE